MSTKNALSSSNAYRAASFSLTDYGLPDEKYGVISIPKLELEMPLYLGATDENTANAAAVLSETSITLDTIEHNPYVLISILSTLHEGVFTIDAVQNDLEMLFGKQYILTETVETETRYRTETRIDERPKRNPITREILLTDTAFPLWRNTSTRKWCPTLIAHQA